MATEKKDTPRYHRLLNETFRGRDESSHCKLLDKKAPKVPYTTQTAPSAVGYIAK